MALAPESSHSTGNGGSQPQTLTADVTTDPDTFVGEHVFDLGHPCVAYYKVTFLSGVGDGETFGGGADEIGVGRDATVSPDNVTWLAPQALTPALNDFDPSGYMVEADQSEAALVATARYLKVISGLYDVTSGNNYAGANHPTVTVRMDVTYL